MSAPILRPHHGMCLAFFEGKGYSDGFSAHMAQVQRWLLKDDPEVRLSPETDVICSCCPNNENGVCKTAEKAARYDKAVLARCGLMPGQQLNWTHFSELVKKHILSPGERAQICGDCQWNELCNKE